MILRENLIAEEKLEWEMTDTMLASSQIHSYTNTLKDQQDLCKSLKVTKIIMTWMSLWKVMVQVFKILFSKVWIIRITYNMLI